MAARYLTGCWSPRRSRRPVRPAAGRWRSPRRGRPSRPACAAGASAPAVARCGRPVAAPVAGARGGGASGTDQDPAGDLQRGPDHDLLVPAAAHGHRAVAGPVHPRLLTINPTAPPRVLQAKPPLPDSGELVSHCSITVTASATRAETRATITMFRPLSPLDHVARHGPGTVHDRKAQGPRGLGVRGLEDGRVRPAPRVRRDAAWSGSRVSAGSSSGRAIPRR